jgi:hypothetical protein
MLWAKQYIKKLKLSLKRQISKFLRQRTCSACKKTWGPVPNFLKIWSIDGGKCTAVCGSRFRWLCNDLVASLSLLVTITHHHYKLVGWIHYDRRKEHFTCSHIISDWMYKADDMLFDGNFVDAGLATDFCEPDFMVQLFVYHCISKCNVGIILHVTKSTYILIFYLPDNHTRRWGNQGWPQEA